MKELTSLRNAGKHDDARRLEEWLQKRPLREMWVLDEPEKWSTHNHEVGVVCAHTHMRSSSLHSLPFIFIAVRILQICVTRMHACIQDRITEQDLPFERGNFLPCFTASENELVRKLRLQNMLPQDIAGFINGERKKTLALLKTGEASRVDAQTAMYSRFHVKNTVTQHSILGKLFGVSMVFCSDNGTQDVSNWLRMSSETKKWEAMTLLRALEKAKREDEEFV